MTHPANRAWVEYQPGSMTVGKRERDATPEPSAPDVARSPSASLPAHDCPYCHGEGEIAYNPLRINDPQCETSARCPTCHGDGTVPARTYRIVVCVLCLEHVNDCECDVEWWAGDEPPTLTIEVASLGQVQGPQA